jgi:hypothetical protein
MYRSVYVRVLLELYVCRQEVDFFPSYVLLADRVYNQSPTLRLDLLLQRTSLGTFCT